MRALVVEDDFALRELLIFLLSELRVEVFVARDTAEAMELVSAQSHELWIVDLCMTGSGPMELVAQAGRCDPPARVIGLYSRGRPEDLSKALSLGAKAGLLMPFQIADFHHA